MPDLDVPEGSLAEARAENLNPVAEKVQARQVGQRCILDGEGGRFSGRDPFTSFHVVRLSKAPW